MCIYIYIYEIFCMHIQKSMKNPSLPWLRSQSNQSQPAASADNCCPAPPGEQSGASGPRIRLDFEDLGQTGWTKHKAAAWIA